MGLPLENKSACNPRDLSWYQGGLQGHKWWGVLIRWKRKEKEKKRKKIYLLKLALEES
jgi:hypothetical protein